MSPSGLDLSVGWGKIQYKQTLAVSFLKQQFLNALQILLLNL